MRFRCHKNGSETKNFTDQKVYEAIRKEGFGFIIRNDVGHEKFVGTDGDKSGHLWKTVKNPTAFNTQESVGWFEPTYHNSNQDCPNSKDGWTHCVDWWDGGKCCWCEDGDSK